MKITLDKSSLAPALKRSRPIASGKSIPELGGVLLEAKGNILRITATDTDRRLTQIVKASIEEEGSALVSCDRLLAIIGQTEGEVSMVSSETDLMIRDGSVKAKLIGMNPEGFPAQKEDTEANVALVKIPAGELCKEISRVISASAAMASGPLIFTGVHFVSRDGYLHLECSDGRRLHISGTSCKVSGELDVTVPGESARSIVSLFAEAETRLQFTGSKVYVSGAGLEYSSKLLETRFPDVRPVIPKQFRCSLKMSRSDLNSALDVADAILSKDSRILVDATGNVATFKSSGSVHGEMDREVKLDAKAEASFAANSKFIRDAAAATAGEEIALDVIDANNPIGIRAGGFIAIIMPMLRG